MTPQGLVLYQVCVDQPGEFLFDGTGQLFDDRIEALTHLEKTQRTRPHAYLSTVTYQRCAEVFQGEEVAHVR